MVHDIRHDPRRPCDPSDRSNTKDSRNRTLLPPFPLTTRPPDPTSWEGRGDDSTIDKPGPTESGESMAYVQPTFNLIANIWRAGNPVINPPDVVADCNLAYGRRVNVASTGGTTLQGAPLIAMNLLMPQGTDIRGPQDTVGPDTVECPAGTGRYYGVFFVDDIGKGFANEHRTAALLAIQGTWVGPYS